MIIHDTLTLTDAITAAKTAVETADQRLRQLGRRTPVDWAAVSAAHKQRMVSWQHLASAAEAANWPETLVRGLRLAGHSDAVSSGQAAKR